MPENSIIRFISVLVVMLIFGPGWYEIALLRLKRAGVEESKAKSKAAEQAKLCSVISTFLYLVSMVSIARLFM